MKTFRFFELLKRMDQLIRLESTGDATCFSEKLGISRRQLYYYIDELRDLGLPLAYDRYQKTFYYETRCRLKIEIKILNLEENEFRELKGGYFLYGNFLYAMSLHNHGITWLSQTRIFYQ